MLNVEKSALSARSIDGIGILTGTRYMRCRASPHHIELDRWLFVAVLFPFLLLIFAIKLLSYIEFDTVAATEV
jgi:hypothetical protein